MKKTMVLYPGLAVSHFIPMMQLADHLLEHGYAVAVALIDSNAPEDIAFAAAVDRVVSSKPSISFHRLPRIQHPPTITYDEQFLLGYFDLVSRHNEHLHDFLCSMPPGTVHSLIMDSLSAGALDVAKKLKIPGYIFHPANAGAFAVILQLPWIRAEGQPTFKEMGDTPLELPGLPPMPASHLYGEVLEDPESEIYKAMMNLAKRDFQSKGNRASL